jgi:long-chain acyl-CoA synthetase
MLEVSDMGYSRFDAPDQHEKREEGLKRLRAQWEALTEDGSRSAFEVPDTTLKERLNEIAETTPDAVYICYRDEQYTYSQINAYARKIANGMVAHGVKKGDRVLISMANSPLPIIVSHACFKIGAIVICANPLESVDDLSKKLNDAQPSVVFIDCHSYPNMAKACRDSSAPIQVFFNSDAEPGAAIDGVPVYDVSELVENSEDAEPFCETHLDDVVVLQYTGGTSGVVKGCLMTNRAYISSSIAVFRALEPGITSKELRMLISLPLGHAGGFSAAVTMPLMPGSVMILADSLKPSLESALQAMERFEANVWPTIPFFLDAYKRSPEMQQRYDISMLDVILSGAAPLSESTVAWFSEHDVSIVEAYGMSETVNYVTVSPLHHHRVGTVGVPVANMDVLLVDCNTGELVNSPGTSGEIIVRGDLMLGGYWNNPERTAESIVDGWFFTGDTGAFDEDGMLRITGRKKDMIITSGFNVYPQEVAKKLCEHPAVADAWVFGVPDERRGEIPAAYVLRKEGSSISSEELIEFCRSSMTRYKVPRAIMFGTEIPALNNGKPDVAAIKEMVLSHYAKG